MFYNILFFGSVWEGVCKLNNFFKVLIFFKCYKYLRFYLFYNLLIKYIKGNYIIIDCIFFMYV